MRRNRVGLKEKFYTKVVKSTLLHGSENWAVDRKIEQRTSVADMRMFRPMSKVTREDWIRNG